MCNWRTFQPEGEDELKKMQLMELAILNGTYRDNKFIVPMTMAAARKCRQRAGFLCVMLTHDQTVF